jgi:hypothetical protein
MKLEPSVEQLLRWRLAHAEAEAPRAPGGSELLQFARPWWEVWPVHFQSVVEHLRGMQIVYGHAMAASNPARGGHPVPAIVFHKGLESEASARVLYFNLQNGRLRLRFKLDTASGRPAEAYEVTFVGEKANKPFLSTEATLSMADEYRIDVELSDGLARNWEPLKVTDRMPFRLILRPVSDGG